MLVAAIWTDIDARTRSRNEQAALAAANAHLASLRHDVALDRFAKAVTTSKRDALQTSIASTMSQLAVTNASLASTNVHAYVQGAGIATLQTCLGGVKSAFGQITAKNNSQAAKDISAVSGACTQLAGGTSTGLVYPFDFPDPDVILVGQTYYAYATNSVAGNIQIIDSTDLTHWTAVGNALPKLPAWATPNDTWAPAVAMIGGEFVLYYAVDVAGSRQECISVATASQPQGPFTDTSTAPLECQKALGGSIDPSSFIDTNGTPYLVWKSGGPGSSKIWSEQLDSLGHGVRPGDQPHTAAGAGPVVGGRDRRGPGPRHDRRALLPLLLGQRLEQRELRRRRRHLHRPARARAPMPHRPRSSRVDPAWPGPEASRCSPTPSGDFWIAFHAWVPGAVGFPNSRDLYLRRLSFPGPSPPCQSGSHRSRATVAASGRSAGGRQRFRPPGEPRGVQAGAQLREVAPSGRASAAPRPAEQRAIDPQRRQVLEEARRRPGSSCSVAASLAAPRTVTSQSPGSGGMSSTWIQRARTAAADLAPQPARPGNPSALSPTRAR